MFTLCPKCTLTLAVTANDLRIGQGYVRCGRCSNVFNALLKLTEAPGDGEAAPPIPQADPATTSQINRALSASSATASSAAAPARAVSPPASNIALHISPDERGGTDIVALDRLEHVLETLGIDLTEDDPPEAPGRLFPRDITAPQSGDSSSQTFESIVLEGDGVTRTSETMPEESLDELDLLARRLSAAAAPAPTPQQQPADLPRHAEPRPGRIRTFDEPWHVAAKPAEPAETPDLDAPALRASASWQRWAWLSGSAVLGLMLALQAVNHWRYALAGSPSWNAPLTRAYAALGIAFNPHWDLGAYDVRQQGAQADQGSAQVIRVRLSLANHATRAQPVPVLRLTLLDRYGKRIAERDLTPSDYWPRGRAPERLMASDERIDSEVAVRDPSAASASFELDVCLRDAAGATDCAGDATAAAAATNSAAP